jgi:hypothetical protein
MSEPLVTYLDDHLGGAQIAIQRLEAMRAQHDNQRLREFASLLLPEIDADDRTLRSVAEKIGAGPNCCQTSWRLPSGTSKPSKIGTYGINRLRDV